MRPIEILLLLANLLMFFVLAVSQLRAVHRTGYLTVIAILIAGAQVLVEGPRWQMVPAYALSGLFFLVWLLRTLARVGAASGVEMDNWLAVGLSIGLGMLGPAVAPVEPMARRRRNR